MSNLDWVHSIGPLELIFFDLPNLLICLLFIYMAGRFYKVPPIFQFFLMLHSFMPFFINGVLFPFSYMPDTLKYWAGFNEIRDGQLGFFHAITGDNVQQASALFSLMPFPVAISPISLGFFTTFLYVALFFWLYKKKVLTRFSAWFYVLYPSMALYSALSLRETFIFVFMVVAVQSAREARWLRMLLVFVPLFAIKFQNFFILSPILIAYLVFGIRKRGVSVRNGILSTFCALGTLVLVAPFAIPAINFFRRAMFVEDGGSASDVVQISGPLHFVSEGLRSGFYFLLKPLPWEATNLLQLAQSLENLGVVLILVLLVRAAWHRVPRKLVFWLIFLVFSLTVYGLVVFNYGTAARYRYPFIAIFVIFVCADCHVRALFRPILPAWLRLDNREKWLHQ